MDVTKLFKDEETIEEIQSKLPKLFYIAEIESSRAGKVGMERILNGAYVPIAK